VAERKNVNNGDWDAKGDLLVGTANDAFDQLAVGADGLALVADAAQATGLRYAAPAPSAHESTHVDGGSDEIDSILDLRAYAGAVHWEYRSGFYYVQPFSTGAANLALTQNQLIAFPFWFPTVTTLDRIGIIAIATALASHRLGIYANGAGAPGALILDAGTVSGTATAGVEISINQAVGPGVVWMAIVAQGANGQVRAQAGTSTPNIGSTTLNNAASPLTGGYRRSDATISGALPDPFDSGGVSILEVDRRVHIAVRIA
jgi:hypothetical protein